MLQAGYEGCIPAQKGLLPVGSIWFEDVSQALDLRVRYEGSVQIQNRGYATQGFLPIQAISAKSRHPSRKNAQGSPQSNSATNWRPAGSVRCVSMRCT